MIVNKCFVNSLFKNCIKTVSVTQKANIYNRCRIGNREWVAFGRNGAAVYYDDPTWPCPPIRFKENNNELLALREKEKGDWRKLTIEEKKILYRASFRQTFAEEEAPTGLWKSIISMTLVAISLGLWIFIFVKIFVYDPKGKTFTEEYRKDTLRKMLDLKMGHITGISSKWDYEKDDWK